MFLYPLTGAIVIGALALGACAEPKAPTDPEFTSGPLTEYDCDFPSVRSLIISYFSPPLQLQAQEAERLMEAAGEQDSVAIQRGFDIMSLIGQASRQATPSATVGSDLTKGLMRCMFDVSNTDSFPGFPDAFNFVPALTNETGGAYYVRGGTSDANSVVLGTDSTVSPPNNLSGVAPPPDTTWTDMLSGNTARGGRTLIYGFLDDLGPPLVYDWAVVPPNTGFSPPAIVAICDGNVDADVMINESSVGFLPYAPGNSICMEDQSLALLESGWGPRALIQRAARWSARMLAPEPLYATTLLQSGSGGTATGFKSKFQSGAVELSLTWEDEPPSLIKGLYPETTFPVSVKVSASDLPVLGVCVYLSGINNNGFTTQLLSTSVTQNSDCPKSPDRDTEALSVLTKSIPGDLTASLADFGMVGVTKTGGLIITATAAVLNRDVASSISVKTNVKPAGK